MKIGTGDGKEDPIIHRNPGARTFWIAARLALLLTDLSAPAARANIISFAGTSTVQAYVGTVSASPSCAIYCAASLDTIAAAWGTPTVSDLTEALSNFSAGTPNPFAAIQGTAFSPVGGTSALWAATANAEDTVTSGTATIFTSPSTTSGGAPDISFNPLSYSGALNANPGTKSVYVLMMTFDYALDGSGLNTGNLALHLGGTCSAAQSTNGGTCLAGAMANVIATGVPGPGPSYNVLALASNNPNVTTAKPGDTVTLLSLYDLLPDPAPSPPGATGVEINMVLFMEGTSPAVSMNLSGDLEPAIPEPHTFVLTASALGLLGLFLKKFLAPWR